MVEENSDFAAESVRCAPKPLNHTDIAKISTGFSSVELLRAHLTENNIIGAALDPRPPRADLLLGKWSHSNFK